MFLNNNANHSSVEKLNKFHLKYSFYILTECNSPRFVLDLNLEILRTKIMALFKSLQYGNVVNAIK